MLSRSDLFCCFFAPPTDTPRREAKQCAQTEGTGRRTSRPVQHLASRQVWNEIAGPDGGARKPTHSKNRSKRRRRDPPPTKGTAEGCGTHHHLNEITHPPRRDGHVLSPAQPKGPPGEEPAGRFRTSHAAPIPETRERRPPGQAPCSGLLGSGSRGGRGGNPIRIRPISCPEARFPARNHYCDPPHTRQS
jgi:hypothetical protein